MPEYRPDLASTPGNHTGAPDRVAPPDAPDQRSDRRLTLLLMQGDREPCRAPDAPIGERTTRCTLVSEGGLELRVGDSP